MTSRPRARPSPGASIACLPHPLGSGCGVGLAALCRYIRQAVELPATPAPGPADAADVRCPRDTAPGPGGPARFLPVVDQECCGAARSCCTPSPRQPYRDHPGDAEVLWRCLRNSVGQREEWPAASTRGIDEVIHPAHTRARPIAAFHRPSDRPSNPRAGRPRPQHPAGTPQGLATTVGPPNCSRRTASRRRCGAVAVTVPEVLSTSSSAATSRHRSPPRPGECPSARSGRSAGPFTRGRGPGLSYRSGTPCGRRRKAITAELDVHLVCDNYAPATPRTTVPELVERHVEFPTHNAFGRRR